jgi:hypothetical protein
MRRTLVLSVAAALMAGIIFAVTGVALSSVHRKSVERGFDGLLSAYVGMLVVNWVSAKRPLEVLSQSIGEPLFDLPLSGWYWQVTALDVSKPESRSSRSLWDTRLTRLRDEDATTSPDGARHGYATWRFGPVKQRLRLLERTVDLHDDGRYLIAVAGDVSGIDDQMLFFHKALAIFLGLLATFLALMMFLQTRASMLSWRGVAERGQHAPFRSPP